MTDRMTATHLYLIAQEAVTNAIRHGRARQLVIRLALYAHGGELTVRDNGSGLVPVAPADSGEQDGDGQGLRIMRYRADVIGGTLDVSPAADGGTRVTCRFGVPVA
jgi:signal transduction histidine kinase